MSSQAAPDDMSSHKHTDSSLVIDELAGRFRDAAVDVVPWFLDQMPRMYFQDTDPTSQLSHLQAIIAARASDHPLAITLKNEDSSEWTALRTGDQPGMLASILASLPHDRSLKAAKIYTSLDGDLVLDTFEFGAQLSFDPSNDTHTQKLNDIIEYARTHAPEWREADIREYIAHCSATYIETLTPLRICYHHDLFTQVSGSDGTTVVLEQETDPTESRITVVFGNARTRTSIERCAMLLARHKIDIKRAYLDLVEDPKHGSVTFVGFVVQSPDGGQLDPESELWEQIQTDLTRVKWVHYEVLNMTGRNPGLRIGPAEIVLGLCHLVHQVLNPKNRFEFTRERIVGCAEQSLPLSMRIAQLFRDRFDPRTPMGDEAFETVANELTADIERLAPSETARVVLSRMVLAVRNVLRTNYYVHGRFGLCMRLNPSFMTNENRPELPYGVFFVHGREFNGFHVRFQDIARGGLRVIKPRSEAQHAQESERLYDEVYGLSFAQQLKNKDIPEGGAKAAILLEADAGTDRCVKAFVDSLLDLITPDPVVKDRIVDFLNDDELIYLGPDEHITPKHIEFIVRRAALRGYPLPTAFMSSKPGAGINHKAYGVTSEGVNVFLDLALQSVGIDPRTQPFTVKITGGPDGDVAGNMMRILHRDYGDNAKVIAISDGSGCAEDPDGFNNDELMRLFREELPIADFDQGKLGPHGTVHTIEQPDGAQLRNTLHNRVKADAFIPAGGRPATIHARNWRDFLDENGVPTSKVIIEGANLFLTPEAREYLSAEGVVIVQDSSANKCGVICSSFEIASCMLLVEEDIIAIKSTFVEQVLDKLRTLARLEAELLLSEHQRHPEISLPQLSIKLSKIINGAAPIIAAAIPSWNKDDMALARHLVLDHFPEVLLDVVGKAIFTSLPERYIHWLMANRLASGIAYREGINFLADMEPEAIVTLALNYLRKDIDLRHLLQRVAGSDLPDRDRVIALLERGGVRAALNEK